MSMQIPHYQEQARRTSSRAQVRPDEAMQRMRSSQAEMRAAIDSGAWRTTRWHESFTDSFVEDVRDARVFVDVGAEVGFYSYLALKHMPDDGRIICVEADPIRCELLREFFAREPRVEIVNTAAHNATSNLMMTKPVGCSATSADVEGAKFAVEADTLDHIIGDAQVDVIKIDIEGAEAHAFEGLQETLQRRRARIFLEMHSWVDNIYPGGKALIEALLRSSGYAIQNLDTANSRDCAGLQGGRFLLTPPLTDLVRKTLSPRLRVAVLSLEPETSASWYVRILTPLAAQRQRIELLLGACRDGARTSIDLDVIDKADLVLIQRLFPARATWPVIQSIIDSGKRIVYEAGDFLLEPGRTDPDYLRARLCKPYIADLMRAAHAVIVPTAALRQAYSAYTSSIQVLPELLHASLWAQPIREPSTTPTIGFLGQASDVANLGLIEDALVDVATRLGNRVRLVFIGCVTPALAALPGVRVLPEPLDYPARARVMCEAGLDIALAPLRDTPFNRCRGGLRWLEYSAAGAAGIYSDLPGTRESVSPGRTGLLVGSSPDAWVSALEELALDPERRATIACTAQNEVLSRHTVEAGALGLAETLEAVAKDPYPSSASAESIPGSALDT